MIGLVDCNNFFASCERVFNPYLNRKPIVVLSNNDGCVIARSNEAKDLGIKMGTPYFEVKPLIDLHNISVFSSNYVLYGDMSSRVMSILSSLTPGIDIYSIDEAFLDLKGISDLQTFGEEIVCKTSRGSGIPVSLGVAPTRTLAKLANRFAKKYKGYNRVCIIDSNEKRIKALQSTDIGDVWGIGRRYADKLRCCSVNTAYDFTQKSRSWVRHIMTVVGERTWLELQGIEAIESDTIENKKQICTSRSFGTMVSDLASLSESVANFASKGAYKLRQQKSLTQGVIVFAYTNRFREDLDQYFPSKHIRLSFPTSDTSEIIKHAKEALQSIFIDGYKYKKAGVILTDIIGEDCRVLDLFDTIDRVKQSKLAKAVDAIVAKNGYESIQQASTLNMNKDWNLKRDFLSKSPSTRLSDIIEIRV